MSVAIKRDTPDVPADGRYHVTHEGEVRSSHRSLKAATAAYRQLLEELGWTPPEIKREPIDHVKAHTDRFFDEWNDYWGQSHGFRPRGGPGR